MVTSPSAERTTSSSVSAGPMPRFTKSRDWNKSSPRRSCFSHRFSRMDTDSTKKTYDPRMMRRLLVYLWRYKRFVIAAFVLTMLGGPLVVAGPPLVKAAVDLYLLPDPAHQPEGYTLWIKQGAEALGFDGSPALGVAFIGLLLLAAN